MIFTIFSLDLMRYPSTDICLFSCPEDRTYRPKACKIHAYRLKIHLTCQQMSYLLISNANKIAVIELAYRTQCNQSWLMATSPVTLSRIRKFAL